jgi:hypothetical protein
MAGNNGSDGGPGNAPRAVSDAAVLRAALPEALLRSILGCWRLGDREEWTITRNERAGARVARRLLATAESDTEYARRAAIPSNIQHDQGLAPSRSSPPVLATHYSSSSPLGTRDSRAAGPRAVHPGQVTA